MKFALGCVSNVNMEVNITLGGRFALVKDIPLFCHLKVYFCYCVT